MKKNKPIYDYEINLVVLFKIIWDGKIKILLITIISILLGFGYNSQQPINYLNSLDISPSKNIEFIRLNNLKKILKVDQPNQPNQPDQPDQPNRSGQFYQVRFINVLQSYNAFLSSIQNTKKIQEHLTKINIEDQKIELFKYANLLEIVAPKEDEKNYIINFKWHDPDEAKKILNDTLNLVSKNLKKLIVAELLQYIEIEKASLLNNDKNRLSFLKEQRAVAKELNIKDNQINIINVEKPDATLALSDFNYYLRGYRAIDKEIELIKNRDYQNLKYFEQELVSFKKEDIKFVDYNIHLSDTILLKDTMSLAFSILFGLILSIFYLHISKAFQSKKVSKKN